MYLFWVALGFTAVHELSLVAGSGLLAVVASLIAEHRLWACRPSSCHLQALELRLRSCGAQDAGSTWTRDRTCVPWIGKWILTYCSTREVLLSNSDVLHFR